MITVNKAIRQAFKLKFNQNLSRAGSHPTAKIREKVSFDVINQSRHETFKIQIFPVSLSCANIDITLTYQGV